MPWGSKAACHRCILLHDLFASTTNHIKETPSCTELTVSEYQLGVRQKKIEVARVTIRRVQNLTLLDLTV
jgi:hypothetical protein